MSQRMLFIEKSSMTYLSAINLDVHSMFIVSFSVYILHTQLYEDYEVHKFFIVLFFLAPYLISDDALLLSGNLQVNLCMQLQH